MAIPEHAEHAAGDGAGAGLLNTAHGHAEMLAFDYHSNTLGSERFVERKRHLLGQSFLYLKPTCKGLGDAREFAKPNDKAVRNIANVDLDTATYKKER